MRRPLNLWLFLLVVVCGVSIWAGRGLELDLPGGDPAPPAPIGVSGGELPDPTIHLSVLNATERSGLAREVGLLIARAGCVAEHVGNADRKGQETSMLINRRLPDRQAADLARRLGGVRLLTEWDGRCTEDAVLVLGRDHERILEALQP